MDIYMSQTSTVIQFQLLDELHSCVIFPTKF